MCIGGGMRLVIVLFFIITYFTYTILISLSGLQDTNYWILFFSITIIVERIK